MGTKPNWGRGIGMALASLGGSMQEEQVRKQRVAEIERLRAQDLADRQAQWEQANPYTYNADLAQYGSAAPVGVPGYNPPTARTNLGGMLALRKSMEPPVVKPTDPMDEIVPAADQRNPFGVDSPLSEIVTYQRMLAYDKNRYRAPDAPSASSGGGGTPSPYPSGITTTELNRLGDSYFGTQRVGPKGTVSGDPGMAVDRNLIYDEGLGGQSAIDNARAKFEMGVRSGDVWPYSTTAPDSLVADSVPPLDLGKALDFDRYDPSTGNIVNDRWRGPEQITMDTAASKLADYIAKQPAGLKSLKVSQVLAALKDMGLSEKDRLVLAGKLGGAHLPTAGGGPKEGDTRVGPGGRKEYVLNGEWVYDD